MVFEIILGAGGRPDFGGNRAVGIGDRDFGLEDPADGDIGKCSVCGIAKAVWVDRPAGVKLCEHCYGRSVREDAQEAGVV